VRTGDGAERQLERVTVKSTWHVSGMRATGSNDVTVNDLFVPEELSVRFGVQPRIDRPLYRHGYVLSLAGAGCGTIVLGVAATAVDEMARLAGVKDHGVLAGNPAPRHLRLTATRFWNPTGSAGTPAPTQPDL
jgi:alkylation response protein AidB-like acyl-CoA dehydrogenase